jgi:hypothetical protein
MSEQVFISAVKSSFLLVLADVPIILLPASMPRVIGWVHCFVV